MNFLRSKSGKSLCELTISVCLCAAVIGASVPCVSGMINKANALADSEKARTLSCALQTSYALGTDESVGEIADKYHISLTPDLYFKKDSGEIVILKDEAPTLNYKKLIASDTAKALLS